MIKRLVLATAALGFMGWASTASAAPPAINHLACYQAKDLKIPAKFVSPASITFANAVSAGSASKCKPKFLCVPTVKDSAPILNASHNYICYQCKGDKPAVTFGVSDQFGFITVQTKKLKFICNPAELS
jgi:hypothetical protein